MPPSVVGEEGGGLCVCVVWRGDKLRLLVILLQERRRKKWGERGAYLFSVVASARTHIHSH